MRRLGQLRPDRLLDRVAEYEQDQQKRLVTQGHEATKGLLLRCGLRFVFGIAAMWSLGIAGGSLLNAVANIVVSLIVGLWAMHPLRVAGAYRYGWTSGRVSLVQNIKQHDSIEAWLDTEANYDIVHVLGLPPIPPPWGHRPGEGKDG